ncbi:MAG TPA: DUF6266 family protein [Pedobacter sp.]|nr:DUF6266 family protein [Pedobacter sp.]
MGILKNGPFGTMTGKIHNMVAYDLNGQNIIRRIGTTNKKPSVRQLTVRQRMAVVIRFETNLGAIINIGFKEEALLQDKSQHNVATSQNIKYATSGVYPNVLVDYAKAKVSQGNLMQPIDPQVELLPGQLKFSWQNPANMEHTNGKDQVMMMAYFPEYNEVSLEVFGAVRTAGEDFLHIETKKQNRRMEVYIAFVAADRETASDSIHLGTING